jgi:Kef-type K+ transport system membrane component KefB/nucleotide-binding universal stress UspA family protein
MTANLVGYGARPRNDARNFAEVARVVGTGTIHSRISVKKRSTLAVALGTGFCLLASAALAAAQKHAGGGADSGNGLGGTDEVILTAQVVLLLFVGRGLGEILQRFGQPAVIGNLLAGLILGPSLFGWIWPQAHDLIFPGDPKIKNLLKGISDMGVMMLLLLTGMETDLKLVRKVGAPALWVTATGVAVPFACGFAAAWFLPPSILPTEGSKLVAALFIGTALSISSIKIVAMVVREMNFMRRNLGQIIVASAIMEDTTGWVIVSITLGIAGAGAVALGPLAQTVIGTAIFLILSYTVGRKLVFWLIRWVNDTFVSEYAVITAILIVMLLMALITQAIGVNTVLGAFVAGVLVGESPILSQHIEDEIRGFITAFMMPIFFGISGLSADLTILKDPTLAAMTAGLVLIASVGKFSGAFAGGMASGLTAAESTALGCGMNARGSTEVIVASIGLTMGALTQNLYTMIVTMAVLTTMAMPPMLRWGLRRLPMRKDEKERLEKEELDEKGFVSRFERLLVTADESANGAFATRLAGFIAGQRGMPVTVVQLEKRKPGSREEEKKAEAPLKEVATEGAKEGHRAASEDQKEDKPEKVEVSARIETQPAEAVKKEGEKGYDMLFLGLEKMHLKDGGFSAQVDKVVKDFEGSLALVIAGREPAILDSKGFDILVPVNGTEASRNGAEIAFALSAPKESTVTALHVGERPASNGSRRRANKQAQKRNQKAVLDDAVKLARRYGHERIKTAVHTDIAPDAAILEEAEKSGANLIVIGASRRVGDHLFLGQTVACTLKNWKGAVVLVVS